LSSIAGDHRDFERDYGDREENRKAALLAQAASQARQLQQERFVDAMRGLLSVASERMAMADFEGLRGEVARFCSVAAASPDGFPTQVLCFKLGEEAVRAALSPRLAELLSMLEAECRRLQRRDPDCPQELLNEIAAFMTLSGAVGHCPGALALREPVRTSAAPFGVP
jgi:hypothetical protein